MSMFDMKVADSCPANHGREDYICEAFTRLCAARFAATDHTNMSVGTRNDLFAVACAMADKLEDTNVAPWLPVNVRRSPPKSSR